jgi:hypothetical protein
MGRRAKPQQRPAKPSRRAKPQRTRTASPQPTPAPRRATRQVGGSEVVQQHARNVGGVFAGVRFGAVGPSRYTVDRFLSDCDPDSAEALRDAWANGDQLAANKVPRDATPAVLILAAYAYAHDVALVDDYDALVQRYAESVDVAKHPDKFFASSCVIMWQAKGEQVPPVEAFDTIGIPAIYEALLGG